MARVFQPDRFGLYLQTRSRSTWQPGVESQPERKRKSSAIGRRQPDRHRIGAKSVLERRLIAIRTRTVSFVFESHATIVTEGDTPGRQPTISVDRAGLIRDVGRQRMKYTSEGES